jgi:hypothetical protein
MAKDDAIVVETVAEVHAVQRETLEVMGYPVERQVHLMCNQRFGDLQSITFPADKAEAVCAAIMAAAAKAMGGSNG